MLRLAFRESVRHVVSVVATDCGGKESSPVLVTVTVTPACSTAWAGTVKTSYRSSQRRFTKISKLQRRHNYFVRTLC